MDDWDAGFYTAQRKAVQQINELINQWLSQEMSVERRIALRELSLAKTLIEAMENKQ